MSWRCSTPLQDVFSTLEAFWERSGDDEAGLNMSVVTEEDIEGGMACWDESFVANQRAPVPTALIAGCDGYVDVCAFNVAL